LSQEGNLSPKFGIGIFELLEDIFEEYFRYKPKYPVKVVLPKIPGQFSLFWASLFGEIPSIVLDVVEKLYMEPLEIEKVDFAPTKLEERRVWRDGVYDQIRELMPLQGGLTIGTRSDPAMSV
jgi:hypothetical protein